MKIWIRVNQETGHVMYDEDVPAMYDTDPTGHPKTEMTEGYAYKPFTIIDQEQLDDLIDLDNQIGLRHP